MKRGHAEHRAGGAGVRALTARAQAGPGATGPEPWYVAEGKRGQQLLDNGRVGPATAVFEADHLTEHPAEPTSGNLVRPMMEGTEASGGWVGDPAHDLVPELSFQRAA